MWANAFVWYGGNVLSFCVNTDWTAGDRSTTRDGLDNVAGVTGGNAEALRTALRVDCTRSICGRSDKCSSIAMRAAVSRHSCSLFIGIILYCITTFEN